jgi:hypothetical protein
MTTPSGPPTEILALEWVSPGTLRTELGITAVQWKAWAYPRDGGCFVLSSPAGGFVPSLLRWQAQQGCCVAGTVLRSLASV